MIAPVQIDAITEADVARVAAIEAPTRLDEDHLREEMQRPWSRIWVAREEGTEAVAFVVTWHVADEVHVLNVATRVDRRRRGLGRALMDRVVAYASTHRTRHVLLEVRRSNAAAIALYRRVGFFAMGVRSRYYPDDEDAVEMVLMIDPETGAVVAHDDEVRLEG
jgi:ribosomal-protein-alanine N-acetyltransferase